MALDIATGQMTSYDGNHSLQPLDASMNPGVQAPTPIVPGQLSGPTYDARDTTGEYQSQMAAVEADCRAAQAAGQDARNAMLAHYSADVLPVGASYGDPVDLPPVPAAAVPPAMSDEYPYSGLEPTAAAAGMAGPYPTGP
jgi:hypothetical protein